MHYDLAKPLAMMDFVVWKMILVTIELIMTFSSAVCSSYFLLIFYNLKDIEKYDEFEGKGKAQCPN